MEFKEEDLNQYINECRSYLQNKNLSVSFINIYNFFNEKYGSVPLVPYLLKIIYNLKNST